MNNFKRALFAVGVSAMLLTATAVPAFAAAATPVRPAAATSTVCPHGNDCPYNGACGTQDCSGYGCTENGHAKNCPNRTASTTATGNHHGGGHHSGQGRYSSGGHCHR